MTVEAIEPHGFCHGVVQALRLADETLAKGPLFCLHLPVHNEHVAEALAEKGLRMVATLLDVPPGGTLLLSAHGTRPELRDEALRMGLRTIDATCPFVARLHVRARSFSRSGTPIVLIGHTGHVEVEGLVGEMESSGGVCCIVGSAADAAKVPFSSSEKVGVLCQTTFDGVAAAQVLAVLSARYPRLEATSASDVCTATRDRQDAVRSFVRSGGDGVVVLGSSGSSNTCRLVEVAREAGASLAVRAASLDEISSIDFSGIVRLGVTSGASTPEDFFRKAISRLRRIG